MNIECPHCATHNAIEYAENIRCHKCEKSFTGFAYRKYKPTMLGIVSALVIGGYAGKAADEYFLEPKRYSTAAIYEIVNYCANPQSVFLTRSSQQKLAKDCICALNKTMEQVKETELKTRAVEFKNLFQQHLAFCGY